MPPLLVLALQLLPVVILLAIGYGVGTYLSERRHLASLARREEEYGDMTVTNLRDVSDPESVQKALYVGGDAVIATDYFKSFVANLRNIIGGEVRTVGPPSTSFAPTGSPGRPLPVT